MTDLGDSVENGASAPAPAPPGRRQQANPLRRRTAGVIIFVVIAMIAALVFVAVSAEGREISRASSNDGGAWLVNRDLGVIGHKNHAAGELSAFLRVSDSPEADVHQADNVVVVHDTATNQLHEVDDRSFIEDLEPTQLPEFSKVHAVDNAVVVVVENPLTIWRVDALSLQTLKSLDGVNPMVAYEGAGLVAATPTGTMAVVHGGSLRWHHHDGTVSEELPLGIGGSATAVTIVDGSAVVLSSAGDLSVVGQVSPEHEVVWTEIAPAIEPMVVLQQPVPTPDSRPARSADSVKGMTAAGELVEVSLGDSDPGAVVLNRLAGSDPLAPITYNGCTYAVVTNPPTFGAGCDQDFEQRTLQGAGQELRLRLVNGWIWVNDLEDGGTWVTNEDLRLEQLDDWGLAADALQDEEDDEGETTTSTSFEKTLVEDPDALGSVSDDDEYNPSEPNKPPVAVNDQARTRTSRSTVVDVLANDTDANNDILLVTSAELVGSDAVVSITPSGQEIQITPAPGFAGTLQLEYQVSDGRSAPVSAFVTVDVISGTDPNNNQAPVAVTDVVATAPGHATTIDVLRNDSDPEGDALALVDMTTESGTLRWGPTGQITFTPDTTTEAGWIELPYTVRDDLGAETQGLLRVEIRDRGANQEPDARNDLATTVAGRPVALSLLANDSDPDGDPLIVGSRPVLISPEGATVQTSTSPDGEFVFAADTPGTYLFSYTVTDSAEGGSERDTARIRIDVAEPVVNNPPIAVRDDVVIPVGQSRIVYVLDNDGDPDGDVIGIVDWQTSPGLLVAEFADVTGHVGFRVSVAPDAPSRPSFTYTISDGISDPVSAPVVIAVVGEGPQDQPPFANDDVIEARAGSTIEGLRVLANDFDPEGGSLRIVGVGTADNATLDIALDGQSVVLTIDEDARTSFSIPYDVEDEAGNRAAAVLRVQIINPDAPNRPPIARTDLARTVADTPVTIAVLRNDSDPDADAIRLDGLVKQPEHGTATISSDGTIRYTPDPSFTGTDLIRYAIVDAVGDRSIGDVFVGVMNREGANQPPVANDDAYFIAGTAVATPLAVLENDFDPEGDPIRVIDVTSATEGAVSIDDFGRVQYLPPANVAVVTTATFQYTIMDNAGNQARATVAVTMEPFVAPQPTPTPEVVEPEPTPTPEVTPTPAAIVPEPTPTPEPEVDNQPPVAVSDERGPIKEGEEIRIEVLENDFDPDGESSDLSVVALDGEGRLEGNVVVVEAQDRTVQLTYTIEDADGAQDTGTITVVVTANRPPQVLPLEETTSFETPINLSLADQATDPDDDVLFFVCCDNIRGGSITNVQADAGVLNLTFNPDDDFVGQAAFAYVVDDQKGHQQAGSVTITVQPPENQPPAAIDNSVELPQGAEITVELSQLASDPDGDTLQYRIVDRPGDGINAELRGSTVLLSAVRDTDVGRNDGFSYEVSDGAFQAGGRVGIVIIEGANEAPVAEDTSLSISAGTSATLDLATVSRDSDPGDSLTWTLNALSAEPLEVSLTGSIVQLAAPANAAGRTARLTYTAIDTRGAEATGAIEVVVTDPQAPAPAATDDEAATKPGVAIVIDVLANDVDPLGEGLTLISASATEGTATVTSNQLQFDPGDFTGVTTVTYTLRDVAEREASGSVTIETVGPPDRPAPPEVVAESGKATISWTAPQANGSTITGYRIVDSDGNSQDVGVQNSVTIDGLTNGETYTFTVIALSDEGPSDPSEPSLPVTPDQVPEAPAPPQVTFGDGELTVEWDEPTNIGSDILGYEVEIGGSASGTLPAGQTRLVWKGLTNGLEYNFRIRAENGAGWGDFSAASPSEHPEGLPAAPVIGVTTRGNLSGSLIVSWQKPNDNGGDIEQYRIVSSTGDEALVDDPDQLDFNWQNLENGEGVTFQVQARNRAGWGPLSPLSNSVVPCGRPDQVVNVVAVRGDGEASLTWDEPAANGCGITNYVITNNEGTVRTSPDASLTFDGLDNGTDYTFTVRAENIQGEQIADSAPSNEVRPAGPPICPSSWSMTADPTAPQTITLTWTAALTNGARILEYQIDYAGLGFEANRAVELDRADIIGLENGTSYTFAIRAVNDVGPSDTCGSQSATTWDVPTALGSSVSFDSETALLTMDVSGGQSDIPITSWSWSLGDPSVSSAPIDSGAGSGPFPTQVSSTILVDGTYEFQYEVCNAVACVQTTSVPETIVLRSEPEVMAAATLDYEYIYDASHGVQTTASWVEPESNGAPIIEYVWEERWMGASGDWHDETGTVPASQFDIFMGSWSGYSTHPNAGVLGQPIRWDFRIAATNSEGTAEFSDWATIIPPLRDPVVWLREGSTIPCTSSVADNDCRRLHVEVFGMGWNQLHRVQYEAGDTPHSAGEVNPAAFCPNTSNNDVLTNTDGYANVELNCHYGFWGNSIRVIIDGVASDWEVWDQ